MNIYLNKTISILIAVKDSIITGISDFCNKLVYIATHFDSDIRSKLWDYIVKSNLFNFVIFLAIIIYLMNKLDIKSAISGLQESIIKHIEEFKNCCDFGIDKLNLDIINSVNEYPEYEGERIVPLSYKYWLIDRKMPIVTFNEIICLVDYQENGSTNTIKKQYFRSPKGFLIAKKEQMIYPKILKSQMKSAIHYVFFSKLSGEKNYIKNSPNMLQYICEVMIMKNINAEIINDDEFDLICKYIKLRNESNISQSELARRIGIARSTIARMERNLHSISLGTFTKLLEVMNYKLEIVEKEKTNESR